MCLNNTCVASRARAILRNRGQSFVRLSRQLVYRLGVYKNEDMFQIQGVIKLDTLHYVNTTAHAPLLREALRVKATSCSVHLACSRVKDNHQRAVHKRKLVFQLIDPVLGLEARSVFHIEAANDGRKHSPHLVQRQGSTCAVCWS
jgi:hypothetical protein